MTRTWTLLILALGSEPIAAVSPTTALVDKIKEIGAMKATLEGTETEAGIVSAKITMGVVGMAGVESGVVMAKLRRSCERGGERSSTRTLMSKAT